MRPALLPASSRKVRRDSSPVLLKQAGWFETDADGGGWRAHELRASPPRQAIFEALISHLPTRVREKTTPRPRGSGGTPAERIGVRVNCVALLGKGRRFSDVRHGDRPTPWPTSRSVLNLRTSRRKRRPPAEGS